jgi:hypothetical protein
MDRSLESVSFTIVFCEHQVVAGTYDFGTKKDGSGIEFLGEK